MKNSLARALTAGFLLLAFGAASAQVALKEDHPDVYYVKEGDTLWDIAARFLESPWRWPELWHGNEEIDNPHLIYPGDVIRVERGKDGKPRLVLDRGEKAPREPEDTGKAGDTVKLSPKMRVVPRETAIPAVPLKEIQPFLQGGLVVSRAEIADAPNVVGGEDARVTFGQGDTVYARDPRKQWNQRPSEYGIYRVGQEYVDPQTREILGYEARRVGTGRVIQVNSDIATLLITDSSEDIRASDRLFTSQYRKEVRSVFHPSEPGKKIRGSIIRFFGRLSSVAKNDVVVINRGRREGLESGDVLDVYQSPRVVRDEVADRLITLPAVKAGTLMLFRVFEKVSYGLVMESRRSLQKQDIVTSPQYPPTGN